MCLLTWQRLTIQQTRISLLTAVIQSRPHTDGPCEESPCGRKGRRDPPTMLRVLARLRGEILPAVGRRKRTPCGVQDDTRRAGRITLKYLNRPPPYVIHPATQQQTRIHPPNAVIQSRPYTDGPCEESPCGRKSPQQERRQRSLFRFLSGLQKGTPP